MYKNEKGFTLVETLVAMAVVITLLAFVVPIYLNGKALTKERMMENKARMLAQFELEQQLSDLTVKKSTKTLQPFQIRKEVTRVKDLWNIQVTIQWKNNHGQMRSVQMEVYRFQNEDLPT